MRPNIISYHSCSCSKLCISWKKTFKQSNVSLYLCIRFHGHHPPAEGGSFQSARCRLGRSPRLQPVSGPSRPLLETWNISSLSSSSVKLQTCTFLTSDKYSEHLCHEGCSVPADCHTEEGWRIGRLKIIFCKMFGQLTSRFILLEKARQQFGDGVLWHK